MTDKQLAEKEAEFFANYNNLKYGERIRYIDGFLECINSKSVELKVVEGKLFAYNDVLNNMLSKDDAVNRLALWWYIKELKTQREQLINEINKGE